MSNGVKRSVLSLQLQAAYKRKVTNMLVDPISVSIKLEVARTKVSSYIFAAYEAFGDDNVTYDAKRLDDFTVRLELEIQSA